MRPEGAATGSQSSRAEAGVTHGAGPALGQPLTGGTALSPRSGGTETRPGQPRRGHRARAPRGTATHPLALHRARHLVVVQVPLEFGRHGRSVPRGRARGEKPGGESRERRAGPGRDPPPPRSPGRAGPGRREMAGAGESRHIHRPARRAERRATDGGRAGPRRGRAEDGGRAEAGPGRGRGPGRGGAGPLRGGTALGRWVRFVPRPRAAPVGFGPGLPRPGVTPGTRPQRLRRGGGAVPLPPQASGRLRVARPPPPRASRSINPDAGGRRAESGGAGAMLGAWLLLWGSVALGGRADTAFLRRAHDSSGHCTYSFTVASPVEAACPEAAGGVPELRAELAALAARLSRLESRERAAGGSGPRGAEPGGARDPQQAAAASRLEAAYGELLRAKSRLEEEKGRLVREKEELGRRLESSAQEISRLRAARCPPGREGPGRDVLRAPAKGKCRAGTPVRPCLPPPLRPSPSAAPCCAPTAAPHSWGPCRVQPCREVAAHCPPHPASSHPSSHPSSHRLPRSRGGM
uniref:Uncharacterized protein n=1 Tax=Taeniopygia guttata TaxID=59729 RepID=A0A674HNP5_TAEGU